MNSYFRQQFYAFALTAFAMPVFAADSAQSEAFASQLSAQEQQEYRVRMDQADTDAQRQQISNEYRAMVHKRTKVEDSASPGGQQHGNPQQGKGHGKGLGDGPGSEQVEKPPELKSGPYGSKNTPQKHGK
jgi:hypothetical protein